MILIIIRILQMIPKIERARWPWYCTVLGYNGPHSKAVPEAVTKASTIRTSSKVVNCLVLAQAPENCLTKPWELDTDGLGINCKCFFLIYIQNSITQMINLQSLGLSHCHIIRMSLTSLNRVLLWVPAQI